MKKQDLDPEVLLALNLAATKFIASLIDLSFKDTHDIVCSYLTTLIQNQAMYLERVKLHQYNPENLEDFDLKETLKKVVEIIEKSEEKRKDGNA